MNSRRPVLELVHLGLDRHGSLNGACESFMTSIKTELVSRRTFKTRDDALLGISSYIEEFYNHQRPNGDCPCLTENGQRKQSNCRTRGAGVVM